MRISIFLIAALLTCTMFAKEAQDVEVLAQNVTKDGSVVHAVGSVVLYSQKYLITADKADYNYETGDLDLNGNVTILEGVNYASRSGHTKLNLKTDKGESTPLFFVDDQTNVWLKCENAILDPEYYLTQKAIVSSCNAQDPDWKIAFTSGELNRESKWMHLYNPVFYADDIPMLYLPYFSFSTDTTRRTGLLRPDIGFGRSEGLYYLQPIFIAPAEHWDAEVSPQIRTNRGKGVHTTVRFIDSPYSSGEFTTGYFQEFADYAAEKNLKNDYHYGYKLMYDRSALLSTKYDNLEDGLWIDINALNDIDYYNTINNETKAYNKLVTSKVNYYAKRDLDYFGAYAKYYIDTSKVSNADTLQELPILQYHRFSNSLVFDNVLYSVDYNAKNYDRSEGTTAFQHELSTPVTLYFSLLEDYLHVSVSENIYMTHVNYGSENGGGNFGQEFKNFHKFSLFTELAKPYDDFFHTMYFGLEHIAPSYTKKQGTWSYTYGANDLIPLEVEEKSTAFKFKQFFYDLDGEKKVSHSARQVYYYSDDRYKYGDLENDIKIYLMKELSFGNSFNYSYEYQKLSKTQSWVTYKDDLYAATLRYTYQNTAANTSTSSKNYNYLTLLASTNYYDGYNLFTSVNYDLKDDLFKSWSVGFKKTKKCWDYSISYRDLTLPKLTSSSVDSVNQQGLMFMFNLYPLGTVKYEIKQETEQSL